SDRTPDAAWAIASARVGAPARVPPSASTSNCSKPAVVIVIGGPLRLPPNPLFALLIYTVSTSRWVRRRAVDLPRFRRHAGFDVALLIYHGFHVALGSTSRC